MLRPWTHSKKLCRACGGNPRAARTRHTVRGLVPRRDAGGPKEQAHLSLGQEGFTPPCRPRSKDPIDLPVRCGLPRTRSRRRTSCCRPATPKLCSFTSMRSQPKSLRALTLLSSSIKPGGMAPRPSRFQTTSRSCSFRHAHLNSTAKKISGNSCGRTGCRTEFSNPSTISSTTAATLGTHSSTSPGRSCPSPDAIGQQSVTQTEDWYYRRQSRGRAQSFCEPGEGARDPARCAVLGHDLLASAERQEFRETAGLSIS